MHAVSTLSPAALAKKHAIAFEGPAVDFFEGGLLGNGALGVVATTRPDAILLHFGHNNVWDMRVSEEHKDSIGTFREVFEKVRAIPKTHRRLEDDPWYRSYLEMTESNYRKPYPRPFPCGTLLLAFDSRCVETLGHTVHIDSGLCRVELLVHGRRVYVEIFVEADRDAAWIKVVDEDGRGVAGLFDRVRLVPDPKTPKELPPFEVIEGLPDDAIGFQQALPRSVDGQLTGDEHDWAFRLTARFSGNLTRTTRLVRHVRRQPMGPLEGAPDPDEAFLAVVQLEEDQYARLAERPVELAEARPQAMAAAFKASRRNWEAYWEKSGVALDDDFLEAIWYRNLYFLHCSTKPEATCPGLWANWSYQDIGTAWHGDYHMNYNTQQPFWVTFATNRVEKHLAYVNMVERVLPLSRQWAEEYYEMRGAFFPHSAYPVPMTMMPYPVPTWGWEVCETPWTVQSLWWHYLYTMDEDFLRRRAFGPMKEATLFLVDYMTRPDASPEAWGDGRYHVFPTVPPELYGLMPGFRFNRDSLIDLTLIRFLFNAFLEACAVLGAEQDESELCADVREILSRFPEYPTATTKDGTRVYVSTPGEDPDIVYNLPIPTATVFPGEETGLHSDEAAFRLALDSYRHQRNEGSNELVLLNVAGARLGVLDLERFKRAIAYRLLPNGACADMVRQVDGRYHDLWPFDYMKRMGIWFENVALPLVITECLLQSYTGEIRLFPNWPPDGSAEFRTLRAVGGFLVSARLERGQVAWVEVTSEKGRPLRLINPWDGPVRLVRKGGEALVDAETISVETSPGERLLFTPAAT